MSFGFPMAEKRIKASGFQMCPRESSSAGKISTFDLIPRNPHCHSLEDSGMDRVLLLAVMLCWTLSGVSPQCDMVNISVPLEREECGKCIMIEVTSCAGFCLTQDPAYKSFLSPHVQHSCSFSEVTYKTVHLPDCPEGVDPTVTYPVPLSCKCRQCSVESTDCSSFHMLSCQAH